MEVSIKWQLLELSAKIIQFFCLKPEFQIYISFVQCMEVPALKKLDNSINPLWKRKHGFIKLLCGVTDLKSVITYLVIPSTGRGLNNSIQKGIVGVIAKICTYVMEHVISALSHPRNLFARCIYQLSYRAFNKIGVVSVHIWSRHCIIGRQCSSPLADFWAKLFTLWWRSVD